MKKAKEINKIKEKNELGKKRGQEEIVGFVMIMVIVAIIFLVLLMIFMRTRQEVPEKESSDVLHFLEGMMEVTTKCAISYEPAYSNIRELLKDCNVGAQCTNGRKACDVLNETLAGAIDSGWKVGEERYAKGYIFNATYNTTISEESIISLMKGNCSVNIVGAEHVSATANEVIISSLKICF